MTHDLFMAWDKNGGFSAIVVDNCENGITPFRFWEFRYEVESDCFKGECFWFGIDRLQRCTDGVCIDFISLAFCAALDIFRDILGHSWPPVVSCRQLEVHVIPGCP